jgi:methyl-accepting chemotaxis protein
MMKTRMVNKTRAAGDGKIQRNHYTLLGAMVLIAVGLLALEAMAQDAPKREGARQEAAAAKADRPAARPGDPEVLVARLTQALDLTADQAGKVKQVLQAFRQSMENWRKEHAQELQDAQKKLQAARDEGKDALKAAREAVQKIQAGRQELIDSLKKQLAEVPLTAEQVEKITNAVEKVREAAADAMTRIQAVLGKLDLTEEQKAAAKKIIEEARAEAKKTEGPRAKAEVLRSALQKIRNEVLTEEQRKKLGEAQKDAPNAGALAPIRARAIARASRGSQAGS